MANPNVSSGSIILDPKKPDESSYQIIIDALLLFNKEIESSLENTTDVIDLSLDARKHLLNSLDLIVQYFSINNKASKQKKNILHSLLSKLYRTLGNNIIVPNFGDIDPLVDEFIAGYEEIPNGARYRKLNILGKWLGIGPKLYITELYSVKRYQVLHLIEPQYSMVLKNFGIKKDQQDISVFEQKKKISSQMAPTVNLDIRPFKLKLDKKGSDLDITIMSLIGDSRNQYLLKIKSAVDILTEITELELKKIYLENQSERALRGIKLEGNNISVRTRIETITSDYSDNIDDKRKSKRIQSKKAMLVSRVNTLDELRAEYEILLRAYQEVDTKITTLKQLLQEFSGFTREDLLEYLNSHLSGIALPELFDLSINFRSIIKKTIPSMESFQSATKISIDRLGMQKIVPYKDYVFTLQSANEFFTETQILRGEAKVILQKIHESFNQDDIETLEKDLTRLLSDIARVDSNLVHKLTLLDGINMKEIQGQFRKLLGDKDYLNMKHT